MVGRLWKIVQIFLQGPVGIVDDLAAVPVADPLNAEKFLPSGEAKDQLEEGHFPFTSDTDIDVILLSQDIIEHDSRMNATHDGQHGWIEILGDPAHLPCGGKGVRHGCHTDDLRR